MSVMTDYHQHGLCFRYPRSWELSEESNGSQRTITLQTAGASFWSLTLFDEPLAPERILDSILQAFQEDYEDVDVYPVQATVFDQPAVAADLDFVYLDLVNSVAIRAFQTDDRSAVVMFQGTDAELDVLREQFNAVTASLAFDEP